MGGGCVYLEACMCVCLRQYLYRCYTVAHTQSRGFIFFGQDPLMHLVLSRVQTSSRIQSLCRRSPMAAWSFVTLSVSICSADEMSSSSAGAFQGMVPSYFLELIHCKTKENSPLLPPGHSVRWQIFISCLY